MKYLKFFLKNSDYSEFINDKNIILPNVSYCDENKNISYNPQVKRNSFSGTINVNDTELNTLFILDDMDNIKVMKVDGIEVTPVGSMTFETMGEHTFYVEVNEPVTTCEYQFHNYKGNTTSLDVSNWDTSKATSMESMFFSCRAPLLDLSNWDTSNVTNMFNIFFGCARLTSLDLSNWDISNVTNMSYMFCGCKSLKEIRMGGNPRSLSDVTHMFDMINKSGNFYYNSAYDYSKIIEQLPSTWTAIPCTLIDGILVPNE